MMPKMLDLVSIRRVRPLRMNMELLGDLAIPQVETMVYMGALRVLLL